MTDNNESGINPSPKDDESNDQMDFRFPIGGGFTISGKNASTLWGKIGWIGIIISTGWTIERIIRVFMGN